MLFRFQKFGNGYTVHLCLNKDLLEDWYKGILFINTGISDIKGLLEYGTYEDYEKIVMNPDPRLDRLRSDPRIHVEDGKVLLDDPDAKEDIVLSCLDSNYIVWDGAQCVLGTEECDHATGWHFTMSPDVKVLIIDLEKRREVN